MNRAEDQGFRTLRHHPESLKILLDSIVCGILTTDGQGKISYTNNSARKILGLSREDLVGSHFDTLPWRRHDGGDVPEQEHPFARALQDGRTVRGETYLIEHDEDETVYFSLDVVPMRDRQGKIVGAAADFIDISEHIRLRQENRKLIGSLRESESCFRLLAESAPVGVFQCDADGGWLYLNPKWTAISGLTRDESFGLGWLQALSPEERHPVLASWRQAARKKDGWEKETRLQHPGGRTVWVRLLGQPSPGDGEGPRFVGIVEDITSQRETLQALEAARRAAEEASHAKSRFLSVVSHEIRTPMTIFMGMLELAMAGHIAPEQRSYLEAAQQSADSLLTLIEDVLLFSEMETGNLALENRPFDLQACIREALARSEKAARDKGIRFRLDLAPAVPGQIVGDPRRLRQVLVNLVENAVKFTDDGEIEVRAEICDRCLQGSEGLRFSVHDSGLGIAGENLRRLFIPFGQLDSSSTRRYGGTGLGLAISKGLIEAMGGEIEVQSRPGEGSVFSFVIPLG